jgi:hypothetical protein
MDEPAQLGAPAHRDRLISAVIGRFARQMTAKLYWDAHAAVVLGFQEFMNRVDADRIKRLPPDTFEKYLAYAMALGAEQHWAQAFAGIVKIRQTGMFAGRAPADSTPIFLSVPSTAWRPICTRYSYRRREPVRQDQALGVEVGGGFSGGGFEAEAAARSETSPRLNPV